MGGRGEECTRTEIRWSAEGTRGAAPPLQTGSARLTDVPNRALPASRRCWRLTYGLRRRYPASCPFVTRRDEPGTCSKRNRSQRKCEASPDGPPLRLSCTGRAVKPPAPLACPCPAAVRSPALHCVGAPAAKPEIGRGDSSARVRSARSVTSESAMSVHAATAGARGGRYSRRERESTSPGRFPAGRSRPLDEGRPAARWPRAGRLWGGFHGGHAPASSRLEPRAFWRPDVGQHSTEEEHAGPGDQRHRSEDLAGQRRVFTLLHPVGFLLECDLEEHDVESAD